MNSELEFLINQDEGYNLEFKESVSGSLAREICAFANANGGKIIVGVSNDKKIKGVSDVNTVKSKIQDYARNMDPPFSVTMHMFDNVLVVNVPEGKKKPYSVNGKFYLRKGPNSQQLARDEIWQFFQKQGVITFDEKVNHKFKYDTDFNNEAYEDFLHRAHIKHTISKQRLLSNIGFLRNKEMNNAGVLFFCNNISQFFLNANITCVLYLGDSQYKILDKKVFESNLIANYENAMSYLKDKLNTEYVIKIERDEYLELPEDALREAILNAIAHRDYFSNSHIQINIFKNSLEIINPASYPKNITIKDLLQGSHPKNLFLFSMMQRANLVEKVGSGIKRINDAMNDYKLKRPKIEYENIWFRIVFSRPDLQKNSYQGRVLDQVNGTVSGTLNGTVTDTQKKILKELEKNPNITYDELVDKIDTSRRTIIRQMNGLKEKGIVKRVGPAKGGHWKVVEEDE